MASSYRYEVLELIVVRVIPRKLIQIFEADQLERELLF